MTLIKSLHIINASLDSCVNLLLGKPSKVYDLNLSENYCPDWGAWEVGREIICNAIDADPSNYRYHSEYDQDGCMGGKFDVLIVETNTIPTIAQLKVIGHGTKSKDSSDIGQFGEGFKLAALTAARTGGMIQVLSPTYDIVFTLLDCEDLDERVLHMIVDPPSESGRSGCQVRILMSGINEAIKGKFLTGRDYSKNQVRRRIPNHAERGITINNYWPETKIFVKGVWICTLNQPSIFRWSFANVKLNRDRGMVDSFEMSCAVAKFLDMHMCKELANDLLSYPLDGKSLFELQHISCYESFIYEDSRQVIRDTFIANHGEKAIISSDDSVANGAAQKRGYKPVAVHPVIGKLLQTKSSPILNAKQIEPKTSCKILPHVLPFSISTKARKIIDAFQSLVGITHKMKNYTVFAHYPESSEPIIKIKYYDYRNGYDVMIACKKDKLDFVDGWKRALLTSIPFVDGYNTKLNTTELIDKLVATIQNIMCAETTISDLKFKVNYAEPSDSDDFEITDPVVLEASFKYDKPMVSKMRERSKIMASCKTGRDIDVSALYDNVANLLLCQQKALEVKRVVDRQSFNAYFNANYFGRHKHIPLQF